jgi:hypothetical protein
VQLPWLIVPPPAAWFVGSYSGTGKKFRRKDYRERKKTGDFLPINTHEMEMMLEAEEGDLDCVASFLPHLLQQINPVFVF